MLLFADFLCFFLRFFFHPTDPKFDEKKNKTSNNFKGGKVAMLKCFCCLATKLFILPWLRDASRLVFKKDL